MATSQHLTFSRTHEAAGHLRHLLLVEAARGDGVHVGLRLPEANSDPGVVLSVDENEGADEARPLLSGGENSVSRNGEPLVNFARLQGDRRDLGVHIATSFGRSVAQGECAGASAPRPVVSAAPRWRGRRRNRPLRSGGVSELGATEAVGRRVHLDHSGDIAFDLRLPDR